MRVIIRVRNQGAKIQHLAQRNINEGLQSRCQINPFQQDQNTFQLSYLVTHNTKVLRSTYIPKTPFTDQLISFVSKIINIKDQFLILRINNKYYDYQKFKEQNKHTEINIQKNNKMEQKKQQNQEKKNKILQENNYGGIQFRQQTIKCVRLIKGINLNLYNIDIENQIKNQQNKIQNPQNMKTLSIQAQILNAYFSSADFKSIIIQNKQSQLRLTHIFNNVKDKFQVPEAIQQEDEQQQQDPKSKKVQNLNFQDYQMQQKCQMTKIYDTTISKYYGQLLRVRKPPLKNHLYYYFLDPYEGFFKQFESKDKYPNFPQEVLSLNLITQPYKDIEKIKPKDISWYMKKDLFYFAVQFTIKGKKQRFKFATDFQQTVDKWIAAFKNCIQKASIIKSNQKVLVNLVKNQNTIMDRIQSPTINKKLSTQYKNAFENILVKPINQIVQKQNTKQDENFIPLPTNTPMVGFSGVPTSQISKTLQSTKIKNEKSQSKASSTSVSSNDQKKENQETRQQQKKNQSLKLQDFKFLKQLGQGSFGQVFLAEYTKNHSLYALKAFKKKKLIMNKQIKFAISQINILKQINNPFIITLHFTFQTPNYIYLGIDFCGGKDLSHHLIQQINFSEEDCRIYAAQLILALQYLHSKDIIYRDLKPENILLDNDGHLKIIDFGLSKQTQDNFAKSFCGSPAYISPEMLKKNGVGKQCDLFSLGAVIYQMIVGQPPFYSQDIKELYDNIANAKLKFPKVVSQKARSLLEGLLRKNPKTRLGCKGFDQIKTHQFFKGIDWNKILKKQFTAPKRAALEQQQKNEQQQEQTQLLKILHEDFDYTEATIRINRFKNFSFIRQGQFQ